MALKKTVQVKIEGEYVKGTVIGDIFHSEYLLNIHEDRYHKKGQFKVSVIERAIEELQELLDNMHAKNVADILAPDDDIF